MTLDLLFSRSPNTKDKHYCAVQVTQSQNLHRGKNLSCSASVSEVSLVGVGEIADVEDVDGIRIVVGDDNKPMIEYLVKWKVRKTT